MKIGLIGHKGSIGRRYAAILNYLHVPWIGFDLKGKETVENKTAFYRIMEMECAGCTHYLIATPTDTHISVAMQILTYKYGALSLLIEKPITKDIDALKTFIADTKDIENLKVNMVCNWKYALNGRLPIEYDYFNTGGDGLEWNCIQLLYLNSNIRLLTKSPRWFCFVEGGTRLEYSEIEQSYITMFEEWISGSDSLWTLDDAMDATKTVLKRLEEKV